MGLYEPVNPLDSKFVRSLSETGTRDLIDRSVLGFKVCPRALRDRKEEFYARGCIEVCVFSPQRCAPPSAGHISLPFSKLDDSLSVTGTRDFIDARAQGSAFFSATVYTSFSR